MQGLRKLGKCLIGVGAAMLVFWVIAAFEGIASVSGGGGPNELGDFVIEHFSGLGFISILAGILVLVGSAKPH